ncbi:dihydrodipicolinate synthase [Bordetella pertussis]|nr:dihydrodipicolinate synthase [Bordetella pertussis]
MGHTALGYRLPMVELSEQYHSLVRTALQEVGLL